MTVMQETQALQSLMQAFAVDATSLDVEGGTDADYGSVTWRTLVCGDKAPSNGLVAGIAEFGPGGTLNPHRHAPPEVYFGLEGDGIVTIDGAPHRIGPGIAVYLPGEAEHGVVAGPSGLRLFYTFPVSRFEEVDYRFSQACA